MTGIGTGEANTEKIVTALGSGSYAAKICDDLGFRGYDDWFLPSKEELNELLYEQKTTVEGFASNLFYWSSSEGSSYSAWAQNFGDGYQNYSSKSDVLPLCAVRAF